MEYLPAAPCRMDAQKKLFVSHIVQALREVMGRELFWGINQRELCQT